METLSYKQKQLIEKFNISVETTHPTPEKTEYIFLVAGVYNQQKSKNTEIEAYESGIGYCLNK
jgi:hypothetical protein